MSDDATGIVSDQDRQITCQPYPARSNFNLQQGGGAPGTRDEREGEGMEREHVDDDSDELECGVNGTECGERCEAERLPSKSRGSADDAHGGCSGRGTCSRTSTTST
jgi:hypothetical protein